MWRKLTGILCAAVMALMGTLLATATPAAADEPSQTGPYRIGDPAGERFALISIFFLNNRVSMVPPVDPSSWYHLNQQWYLRDAGSGNVNLVNAREQIPGLELCVVPAPTPGVEPHVRGVTCSGAAEQAWAIEPVTGGVRVISDTRGTCLTMPSAGSSDSHLFLEPCGGADQVFVFSPVE